jgi:catechol 2,3-dioxygenase-like lactoylglutathione lyase family enzyme
MRPHISLDVRSVPRSVAFYEKLFGVAPHKQTVDYAKFDLLEPALNISMLSSRGIVSSVNHFGIEVDSIDEIKTWSKRLREQGILEKTETNQACCFARQDKLWSTDPDGNAWEVFIVHEQLEVEGYLASTGCCVSQDSLEPRATPAACGCR